MKSYKSRFIQACKQLALEYETYPGHVSKTKTCQMCKIYIKVIPQVYRPLKKTCIACPIAYIDNQVICVSNLTYIDHSEIPTWPVKDEVRFTIDEKHVISKIRAKFYRTLISRVIDLPPKEFWPTVTIKPNSLLKQIVGLVDRQIYNQFSITK